MYHASVKNHEKFDSLSIQRKYTAIQFDRKKTICLEILLQRSRHGFLIEKATQHSLCVTAGNVTTRYHQRNTTCTHEISYPRSKQSDTAKVIANIRQAVVTCTLPNVQAADCSKHSGDTMCTQADRADRADPIEVALDRRVQITRCHLQIAALKPQRNSDNA